LQKRVSCKQGNGNRNAVSLTCYYTERDVTVMFILKEIALIGAKGEHSCVHCYLQYSYIMYVQSVITLNIVTFPCCWEQNVSCIIYLTVRYKVLPVIKFRMLREKRHLSLSYFPYIKPLILKTQTLKHFLLHKYAFKDTQY